MRNMKMRGPASAVAAIAFAFPLAVAAQNFQYDWDYKSLAAGLHKFTGPLRGNYMQVYPPLVSEQILEGLSGSSDPTVDLPGGLRLISGCRRQSCDEKAAVIVTHSYQVRAAAVIGPQCHWKGPPHRTRRGNLNGASRCEADHDILTVFLRRSDTHADDLDKTLKDWARTVDPKPMVHWAESAEPREIPHEIAWLK